MKNFVSFQNLIFDPADIISVEPPLIDGGKRREFRVSFINGKEYVFKYQNDDEAKSECRNFLRNFCSRDVEWPNAKSDKIRLTSI